jgi:hypothetical protein
MSNNVTLPAAGSIVETIDEGSGVERQVVALGSIGKAGSETQLSAGPNTAANSVPVVLNSDPDLRPSAGNITAQDTASSSTTGQNGASIITGTPTANSFRSQAINGESAARILIGGTWTGTLQFEGSLDGGTTWTPLPARVVGSGYTQSAVTGNGQFLADVSGLTNFRARSTAAMTGTATVGMTFSTAPGATNVLNPVRLFDNASGNSAVIDKAGGVGIVGNRPFVVKGTINNGQTTYSVSGNQPNIGGLITVATGLPAGTIITALILRIKCLNGNFTSGSNLNVLFFDANPTASTITDNSNINIAAADLVKTIAGQSVGVTSLGQTVQTSGLIELWTFTGARQAVDGSGNMYFEITPNGSLALAATNVLAYEVDGTY